MMAHDPEICCLVETKIKVKNKDNVTKVSFGIGRWWITMNFMKIEEYGSYLRCI